MLIRRMIELPAMIVVIVIVVAVIVMIVMPIGWRQEHGDRVAHHRRG